MAAFLYWQAVTKDDGTAGRLGVTFNGMPLSSVDPLTSAQGSFGKQLGVGTPPCWSGGGGTGSSGGAHKTYTYRADVLRFLTWDETTGKLAVNGAHQVQLPDGGDVAALGASLVVVYSDPARPFSAIVLYDGNYTMDQSTERMDQSIKWFYDGTASGRLTHIVGPPGRLVRSDRGHTIHAPLPPGRVHAAPPRRTPQFRAADSPRQ